MKVILKQDIKDLGKKDEMVNVSDGYAKNYLIPRGLVVEATDGNVNEMKNKQAALAAKLKREKENAQALAKEISGKVVTVKVKAGANGKLFGALTTKDVADAFKQQYDLDIDKKKIVIDEAIKATGEYAASIKVYSGISASVKLNVTAE